MRVLSTQRIDWFSAVHLLARILSVVSIGTLLLFAVGENGTTKIAFREWLGLLFFPFGVAAGMLLALRWVVWGGALAELAFLAGVILQNVGA